MNTSHETLDQYEAAYIGILLWLPVQEASRYVAAVDNADITTPALRGIHQLIAANLDAGKTAEPDSVLAAINDIEHTKHWKKCSNSPHALLNSPTPGNYPNRCTNPCTRSPKNFVHHTKERKEYQPKTPTPQPIKNTAS